MPDKNLMKASSRYAIVAEVLAKTAKGESLSAAIGDVTKNRHVDHQGRRIQLSKRNLYRWINAYQKKGIEGLCDKSRVMSEPSRSLSTKFLDFMVAEKKSDSDASIPEIICRAVQQNVVRSVNDISRTSAWRAARRMNLPIFADKGITKDDMRRFAYANRMQMVISDGKHFRAGLKRAKRVVMSLLDDCSRFGLFAAVGPSESTELFVRALWETTRKWGTFMTLFVDNGSGFVSEDTIVLCAKLGINLIHGTERYPEGHGKIERYHGTLIQDLLRSFDGNPAIDPSCSALENRINHYLSQVYNRRSHEGLGGISPEEKFLNDAMPLRPLADELGMRQKLMIWKKRQVSRDNLVSVKGVYYDMPRGYAGCRVETCYHILDKTVFFMHESKLMELHPVNLEFNAQEGHLRAPKRHRQATELPVTSPCKTAATMQYEQDFGPIVTSTGDFYKQNEED